MRRSQEDLNATFPVLERLEATWGAQQVAKESQQRGMRKSQEEMTFKFKRPNSSPSSIESQSTAATTDIALAQELGLGSSF